MTRLVVMVSVMISGALMLVGGCSSSPPPPPAHAAAEEQAPAPAAAAVQAEPECVDAKDQKVQCLSDQDCCPRFVCGRDPELSHSQSYCIFGG